MPAKRFVIIFNLPYAMSDSPNRTNADKEWDDLLHQWRTQVGVPPRPSFYGRVHARLLHATVGGHPPVRTWRHWPAYAALLAILLLLSGDDAGLHTAGEVNQESSNPPEASFSGN